MATKKKPTPNKSAFVRSLPAELSALEVVEKGKEQGISLTEGYVYTIRSAAKKSSTPTKPAASDRGAQFRRLVFALGMDHAKAMMAEIEKFIERG